jgi:hypothetical protein
VGASGEPGPGATSTIDLCLGDECVSVLEWRGPSASMNDIELAESIAGSVELQAAWTDPAIT